jgi:hypothetical protein
MSVRRTAESRSAVEVVANGRDCCQAEQPLGGDGWDDKLSAELELVA